MADSIIEVLKSWQGTPTYVALRDFQERQAAAYRKVVCQPLENPNQVLDREYLKGLADSWEIDDIATFLKFLEDEQHERKQKKDTKSGNGLES